ncbi:hypothetical protein [Algicola sagamiensis]|uniref:hypothetical protein n=1 Tax=Algicola sagamiensis TaxID=163869 RepID=UPI00037FB8DF|nr:hypothetical protein [Algicola sagamiensis]
MSYCSESAYWEACAKMALLINNQQIQHQERVETELNAIIASCSLLPENKIDDLKKHKKRLLKRLDFLKNQP